MFMIEKNISFLVGCQHDSHFWVHSNELHYVHSHLNEAAPLVEVERNLIDRPEDIFAWDNLASLKRFGTIYFKKA